MHDGVAARGSARRHARRLPAGHAGGARIVSSHRRVARMLVGVALVMAAHCPFLPLDAFDVIAPAHAAGAAANDTRTSCANPLAPSTSM